MPCTLKFVQGEDWCEDWEPHVSEATNSLLALRAQAQRRSSVNNFMIGSSVAQ